MTNEQKKLSRAACDNPESWRKRLETARARGIPALIKAGETGLRNCLLRNQAAWECQTLLKDSIGEQ
jgi:hypothetical protein